MRKSEKSGEAQSVKTKAWYRKAVPRYPAVHQMPWASNLIPYTLPLNSFNFKHQESSIQYPASSIHHRASSSQWPIASSQYPAARSQQPATSCQQPFSF